MRNLRSAGRLISLICDICLDHGTYQGTEDDGEDVDVHGGAGEAPKQERAQCAPEGADDHDGRVGEVVAKVAQKDLAYDGGGVEQRQDDCGRKLVGERPREGGDVERDREIGESLKCVGRDLYQIWVKKEDWRRCGYNVRMSRRRLS